MSKAWDLQRALLHGGSAHEWYGRRGADGYLLPFQLLFLPLGALPAAGVAVVGRCGYLALVIVSLRLWDDGPRPARHALWPLVASVPVAQGLVADHLLSAFGLAALSLALWAQRRDRWWLVGAALAIGLVRSANAIPVAVMILVGGWGRPERLLKCAAAGAATLAPLLIASFVLDPQWLQDYRSNVALYPIAGLAQLALVTWGPAGLIGLQVVVAAAAALLVRRSAGTALDSDRSALGLALSSLSAPMEGLYTGVFVLPALVRVGARESHALVPWLASGIAWVVVVASTPILAGPHWAPMWSLLTTLNLWLLLNCYPLLMRPKRPPGRSESPAAAAGPTGGHLP